MAEPDSPPPPAPELPELHALVVGRDAMACRFEVVFNAGEVPDATELGLAALDLVDAVEERITVYRDSSELARLNATAPQGWQPVAADIVALLVHARSLHARTAGGFDPAAGSLVRAWGFLHRQGRTPDAPTLAAARAAAGMEHVEIDEVAGRVRFTRPGLELNLGAIGKGWALDAVIGMLTAAGVASVLVHGGSSSVRAIGLQGPALPGRRGWRVGIRHPLRPGRRLATVTLVDAALGTSGSGTQFFVDRGRRQRAARPRGRRLARRDARAACGRALLPGAAARKHAAPDEPARDGAPAARALRRARRPGLARAARLGRGTGSRRRRRSQRRRRRKRPERRRRLRGP
jgi:thiamine biosynthesis lipoprotein